MESVSPTNVSVQTISPTVTQSSLPIPEELVVEIFSRLPLKAIARCRCLSKLWSSILRSEYFTELFLTKSCARPQLLFAFHDENEVVFFSSPQPENPEENSYVVANRLACFSRSYGLSVPTSGFFCYIAEWIFEGIEDSEFVPVICNPTTGQSLTLPRLNSKEKFGLQSYLGYDPIGKQLKVLSRETAYGNGIGGWISASHQVLTLGGTNKLSWRLVECSIPHRPFTKCICISGVIYYTASTADSSYMRVRALVVCFDVRTEKFSFVNFMETSGKEMHVTTTLINYNGKLGLLMSGDSRFVSGASKILELWVLQDARKNEWSKHVYVLPPSWKDVVSEDMRITGMVGTNEIVLAPWFQRVPSYVIYYNVERKTIRKVGIRGLEAFQDKKFNIYLNYVENVELL